MGTQLAYKITGISADDLDGGALTGTLTVDSDGRAIVAVKLKADALTEGAETLKLELLNGHASVDVVVNDTSLTPPPVGQTEGLRGPSRRRCARLACGGRATAVWRRPACSTLP